MCLHIATLDESLATNLANIWSFSCVGHRVLLQMFQHSKGCTTHFTVVWLLPSVHSLVSLPHVLVRELLLAELARVKVLANVDVPVHPHVVAGGVVLSTLNTDVSLLSTRT